MTTANPERTRHRRFELPPLSALRPRLAHVVATESPVRPRSWFGALRAALDRPLTSYYLLGTGQNTTHMLQFSGDTNRFFTANISSDSISIFERAAGSMNWNQTVVSVGKGPEGFDVSPDGSQLWTAHSRDGGVSVIDVASKKVIETLPVGTRRSNRLKFTPDGKKVLISDLESGELVVVDVAARKVTKKLPLGQAPEGILIEPGGARAYVAVAGDNHVAVIDLKSMSKTRQFETGGGPDGMAWIGGPLR